MASLLLATCGLGFVVSVVVVGVAAACDDLAFWQWRVCGAVAAVVAGFGLHAIHAYGRAQGYW